MAQPNLPAVTAIVVAAGASRRMGFDKLSYRLPDGRTVLETSCAALAAHPVITQLVLVCGGQPRRLRGHRRRLSQALRRRTGRCDPRRQRAQRSGRGDGRACCHPRRRPPLCQRERHHRRTDRCRRDRRSRARSARQGYGEGRRPVGRVLDTPDRGTLYAVQTPQCFRRALYTQALAAVTGEKARLVTDDCSLFELAGLPVRLTEGDYANYKITTKEDLQKEKTMRIGHGYDVHRLVEDRKLIMGGVEIPYEKGLLGHSDADVLLHAVMDAVLGAAALGDIGQHFPDNDPAYKGADSLALTREVARIIAEHGYKVGNIDATILCQRPKLAPHIPAMRRNIADAFGLPVDAVSVKATTEEHLGFTGEGLGIAAHAVALIE